MENIEKQISACQAEIEKIEEIISYEPGKKLIELYENIKNYKDLKALNAALVESKRLKAIQKKQQEGNLVEKLYYLELKLVKLKNKQFLQGFRK